MPANEFEKQVQKKLGEFRLDPSASVWEKVEEEVRKQIEHPVKNISDIVMTWFTALILIGIIAVKLFSS